MSLHQIDETRIPRIIHQTYPGNALPEDLARNVAAIKAMNPQWEHRLYDDAAIEVFIASAYGDDILAAYRSVDARYGAARADLFRYLVIHAQGGVYLDIKSATFAPLDTTIRHDDIMLLAQWRNEPGEPHEGAGMAGPMQQFPGGEFQQWHVIAAPGHPFLAAVIAKVLGNIKAYRPWIHGTGRRAVIRLTGPIAYTLAIDQIRDRHPHRLVRGEDAIGLTYSVLASHTAHRNMFATHYSKNTMPLVVADGFTGIAGRAFGNLKRALMPVLEPSERIVKSAVLGWRAARR